MPKAFLMSGKNRKPIEVLYQDEENEKGNVKFIYLLFYASNHFYTPRIWTHVPVKYSGVRGLENGKHFVVLQFNIFIPAKFKYMYLIIENRSLRISFRVVNSTMHILLISSLKSNSSDTRLYSKRHFSINILEYNTFSIILPFGKISSCTYFDFGKQ